MGFKQDYPIDAMFTVKVGQPPIKTFANEHGFRSVYGNRRMFSVLRAIARLEYDKHLVLPGVYYLRIIDKKRLAYRMATPEEVRKHLGYDDAPAPA